MTSPTVPPEVRRFVLTSIPSVPYLEALLLLRSEAARAWRVPEVARRLYVPDARALELLAAIAEAGLATRNEEDQFRFSPASPELAALIADLAATYSQHLVSVTDLIHSRVDKRAQAFAEAFRWKKEGS